MSNDNDNNIIEHYNFNKPSILSIIGTVLLFIGLFFRRYNKYKGLSGVLLVITGVLFLISFLVYLIEK